MPFILGPIIGDNKTDFDEYDLLLIVNPKEIKISDSIPLELSIILEKAVSNNQIIVVKHLVKEYLSSSRILISDYKIDAFKRYTEWCAYQIALSVRPFQNQFKVEVIKPIIEFKKDLVIKWAHLVDFFALQMQSILND